MCSSSARNGRVAPGLRLTRVWPGHAGRVVLVQPVLAGFALQVLAGVGRFWPGFGRVRPVLTRFWPGLAGFGRVRPVLARLGCAGCAGFFCLVCRFPPGRVWPGFRVARVWPGWPVCCGGPGWSGFCGYNQPGRAGVVRVLNDMARMMRDTGFRGFSRV